MPRAVGRQHRRQPDRDSLQEGRSIVSCTLPRRIRLAAFHKVIPFLRVGGRLRPARMRLREIESGIFGRELERVLSEITVSDETEGSQAIGRPFPPR